MATWRGVARRAPLRIWLERDLASSDRLRVALLGLVVIAAVALGSVFPTAVPDTAVLLPMLIASVWLAPRAMPAFLGFCLLALALLYLIRPHWGPDMVIRLLITLAVGVALAWAGIRRSRLGVSGTRTESMFIDLRDRIARQGDLPKLPPGWQLEAAISPAGGTAFSGDFIVASRDVRRNTVDLVVVDVSGKGVGAGTRSLLLSGAFGGLLSAVPARDFLAAANDYLVRQEWPEGFATAVHLHLNTKTGDFEVRTAGHPPALWMIAGSGRWCVVDSSGPALGITDSPVFSAAGGSLRRGDALFLYTDGVVENRTRDIASGIDRLAGLGDRLIQTGFRNGAQRVLDGLPSVNDDRAVLVIHRRG